jgi:hypothetical protein
LLAHKKQTVVKANCCLSSDMLSMSSVSISQVSTNNGTSNVSSLSNGSNSMNQSSESIGSTNNTAHTDSNTATRWTPKDEDKVFLHYFNEAFVGEIVSLLNVTMAARSNEVNTEMIIALIHSFAILNGYVLVASHPSSRIRRKQKSGLHGLLILFLKTRIQPPPPRTPHPGRAALPT